MKRDLLVGHELKLRVAVGELLQRDLCLEPAQRGADAEVDAAPEGERAPCFALGSCRTFGLGEHRRVAARGGQPQEQLGA